MTTRRDLLRSTLPAAAFAVVGGESFGSVFNTSIDEEPHATLMSRMMPELRFDGVPFNEVIDFLRDTTQANIAPRWSVITAAGVKKDAPVTTRLRNVKFHNVLDIVLESAGAGVVPLGYVAKDGIITISTAADLGISATTQRVAGYFAPSNFFADGQWKLPKLPYGYDALEPHIDAKTMEIHYTKHHQAYVTNLNKALKQIKELPDDVTPQTVEALQRDVSFNMGGHALHSIFWGVVGPGADGSKMGGEPTGPLLEAINAQFGSFEKFKKYFTTIATTVKGSGWAILGASPVSRSLVTYAIKDQDSTHPAGVLPILGIDVWEHAYYLKYQNDRAAYVKAWWETINWSSVAMLMG